MCPAWELPTAVFKTKWPDFSLVRISSGLDIDTVQRKGFPFVPFNSFLIFYGRHIEGCRGTLHLFKRLLPLGLYPHATF